MHRNFGLTHFYGIGSIRFRCRCFFWGGVQKGAVCLYLYRFTRSSLITPLQFRPNAKS